MGSLTLPASGIIYLDTSPIIYSVEKHPDFSPLLLPLWAAAKTSPIKIVTSELALLETFVGPLKNNDLVLLSRYEQTLKSADFELLPISEALLRDAANLRAQFNLKTPDAIHAATGLHASCVQFITNDGIFRRVTGLKVVVLSDLL